MTPADPDRAAFEHWLRNRSYDGPEDGGMLADHAAGWWTTDDMYAAWCAGVNEEASLEDELQVTSWSLTCAALEAEVARLRRIIEGGDVPESESARPDPWPEGHFPGQNTP